MNLATAAKGSRSSKEDREQALVQAAFNQIAERGFEGLRTREVAAGGGPEIPAPPHYFPTQETPIPGGVAHPLGPLSSPPAPPRPPPGPPRNHPSPLSQ